MDYTLLENILVGLSMVLSVIVLAQVIYYVILCARMYKRQKAKKDLENESKEAQRKAEKEEKTASKELCVSALALAAFFPVAPLISCIVLAAICGVLVFKDKQLSVELKKPLEEKPAPKPAPAPAPVPKPTPIPVAPTAAETVLLASLARDAITIEEAHDALADDVAAHFVETERSEGDKRYQKKSIINIDTLSEHFATGDTVSLTTLKEKGLITPKTDYVKVLARGFLDKRLTVEAQDFSSDAVKMIILTGGRAVKKA